MMDKSPNIELEAGDGMYPELMVIPMREELVRAGIKEARTADEVDAALAEPGTTLVVVNSICGCAAGIGNSWPCTRRHFDYPAL